MDSRENALAAEANTLWNSMTPELQEKCPRRGESVPRLLRQYEHIIGERPRYPKTVFSTVSWALGALFALALVWLLRVDNDFAQRAIRWSALVFIVVVDLGWYYWCHWHHAKHEEELLAWDRSVRSVLGKLSDFICLVNGPSDRPLQTVSPAGDVLRHIHSTNTPWLSSEGANADLLRLAMRVIDAEDDAFGGLMTELVAQVNRAYELGIEPISKTGPADGLKLLLEIAERSSRHEAGSLAQSPATIS